MSAGALHGLAGTLAAGFGGAYPGVLAHRDSAFGILFTSDGGVAVYDSLVFAVDGYAPWQTEDAVKVFLVLHLHTARGGAEEELHARHAAVIGGCQHIEVIARGTYIEGVIDE